MLGTPHILASSVPLGFRTCRTLPVCLQSLDPLAATSDGSIEPEYKVFTLKLSTFGEPAKHELLRRAAGSDQGWRNLSGAILANWKAWSPADVPELRTALLRDPGGWMAGPLRTIGTPAAIEALVEDLPKGSDNQTDFALEKLGPKAIPFLMPLFENEATSQPAARVVGLMGNSVAPLAQTWSNDANDPAEPLKRRLADLRAISALREKARYVSGTLRPLSSASDPLLRHQADVTIESIESFVQRVAPHVYEVSIIELIANPVKYDGKRVRVIGFLRLEFEGDALYLHREDYEHAISKNSIWLDQPQDLSKKQAATVDRQYVICEGVFNARDNGMFSGSLSHINRLEPWLPAEQPLDPAK